MRPDRAAFRLAGVPVFLPGSALLGVLLVSWFALPTAQEVLGAGGAGVYLLALAHAFAVYLVVLVHELGHTLAALRLGYPVAGIVLHVIGGHTAFRNRFTSPGHQAFVAIAGPVLTGLLGLLGWWVYGLVEAPAVRSVLGWLNWTALVGSVLNLLPGAPLDGGAVVGGVVWRLTGSEAKGMRAGGYGGLVVAAAWVSLPWFIGAATGFQPDLADLLLSFFVGTWLAVAAFGQLRAARSSQPAALAPAGAWQLKVRRACAVPPETDCAGAVATATAQGAGAIVLTRDGLPVGIVREAALASVPAELRATTPVASVARRIGTFDRLPADVTAADFRSAFDALGADEWLVVDGAGRIVGVAVRSDQDPPVAG